MKEIIRCDTCGREWVIRSNRPVPFRVEGHYARAHRTFWDSARFTIRSA